MSIVEAYKFDQANFDEIGLHKHSREFFLSLVAEFENDFYQKHQPLFPNHLMANDAVMDLITRSLDEQNNYNSGVELVDGDIDLEANMEMDKYSEKPTIYAIGSTLEVNLEEPILLVIIPQIPDGLLHLCWYPDDDEEEEVESVSPELIEKY